MSMMASRTNLPVAVQRWTRRPYPVINRQGEKRTCSDAALPRGNLKRSSHSIAASQAGRPCRFASSQGRNPSLSAVFQVALVLVASLRAGFQVMFSKRHGFATTPPIRFRHDAPEGLRHAVIQAAYDHLSYEQIRTSICRTLYLAPDKGNWSEIPNIRDEVERVIQVAEWYRVYDVIEGLVSFIEGTYGYQSTEVFADRINSIFVDTGAGWQLVAGDGVVVCGDADFEEAVQSSQTALSLTGFDVAAKEIREALGDLSRRPEADLTGAVHHALGALEATARYVSGTDDDLGRLASRIGLPAPLDGALKQMWGFSSNFGRHVSPTKIPTEEEAQLIVHLSSAYCRYLAARKR